MYQALAGWLRQHKRACALLLILLAVASHPLSIRHAMEGMINGLFDGYGGKAISPDPPG